MTRTLLATLICLSLSGCGAGTATVTGEVTYDGRPVGDGTITLTPADGKGPVTGADIKDGTYTVRDVPPGPKVVRVEAYRKVNFASSSEEMMTRAAEQKKRGDDSGLVDPADLIPPDAEGNNRHVEIKPGVNPLNLLLAKPPARKR